MFQPRTISDLKVTPKKPDTQAPQEEPKTRDVKRFHCLADRITYDFPGFINNVSESLKSLGENEQINFTDMLRTQSQNSSLISDMNKSPDLIKNLTQLLSA